MKRTYFPNISSALLNDTTAANPYVECSPDLNDTVTFVLTVTDSDGNTESDSVDVLISSIRMQHLYVPDANYKSGRQCENRTTKYIVTASLLFLITGYRRPVYQTRILPIPLPVRILQQNTPALLPMR